MREIQSAKVFLFSTFTKYYCTFLHIFFGTIIDYNYFCRTQTARTAVSCQNGITVLRPADTNRRIMKKTIEEDKQYVAESADGEKPATSELVLNLTSDDTAFLSKIDRICFKLTAVPGSATGVPLKDTQWLKVTSIKLSVPGGVNVDLN